MKASKVISHKDKFVNPEVALDPSSAQFQLWLAQMKRDHNDISDAEMTKAEIAVGGQASGARCMYNPFTGEFKRIKPGDF
jgi:hypothetical protein